jgi:cysteine-rich repeat protein
MALEVSDTGDETEGMGGSSEGGETFTPGTGGASSTSGVGTSTDVGSSTDGPEVPCGNGVLDEGEDCDDGDQIDGNGCNNDCTVSGEELWAHTYAPGIAHRVAVYPGGDIAMVSGTLSGYSASRYGEDGEPLWPEPASFASAVSRGLAVDEEGDMVAAGATSAGVDSSVWLGRFDSAGDQVWPAFVTDFSGSAADALALFDDGGFVAVGVANDGEQTWLRRYDRDGASVWPEPVVFDGGPGVGVGIGTNEEITAVGVLGMACFSSAGSVLWEDPLAFDGREATAAAAAGGGETVVAGMEGESMWIQKHDHTGQASWAEPPAEPLGSGWVWGVAVGLDGTIVVSGSKERDSTDWWLNKHDADGRVLWPSPVLFDGTGGSADSARAVAVGVDGAIVAAGYTTDGNVQVVRVAKYNR